MEIKEEDGQNNIFISQTSLKDSIFNKDTIKYDILIKYPDGSTLRNYNDDQYPVIPFCLDEDSIKAEINLQNLRNQEKRENNININEKIDEDNNFKENNNKNENIENNEFNKNINDFNFQNQSIELKDKIFVLNSQSDKNENTQSMKKENEEKNEENNNVKNDLDINLEKENGKKISDIHFDSLEESMNNQNNQKISNTNNLNDLKSEKEQDKENNENAENINESNGQIKNNQEINNLQESEVINNLNQNMNDKEKKYENNETNTDIHFYKDNEDKNSSEKKNAFSQTNNLNEKDSTNNNGLNEEQKEKNDEKENDNKEFFEEKLKSENQTLEDDGNPNNKKVRKNKNYNQKILNNKNLLIQEQKQNKLNKANKDSKANKENKEKRRQKNKAQKNLNQKLFEKEMNEIKRRLELKQNLKRKKELENQENAFGSRLKTKNIKVNNIIETPEITRNLSPNRSIQYNEKVEKFNTPTNNDICSQLLQAALDNEKQLLLVPFARQKEKIKKTFNTIGKSNGISYSEFRVIKGEQNESNNILNIIRDDDRRSLSKRKEYSDSSSMRRSNFHNLNVYTESNSEFKL